MNCPLISLVVVVVIVVDVIVVVDVVIVVVKVTSRQRKCNKYYRLKLSHHLTFPRFILGED